STCLLLPLQRPPTPPLVPYTTLFRSIPAIAAQHARLRRSRTSSRASPRSYHSCARTAWNSNNAARSSASSTNAPLSSTTRTTSRSEEHMSELQSRENLVRRLLLEKKK